MPDTYNLAVCIGRFQLPHDAQLILIRKGLELAERVLVIIGSAHQARSPRNPFSWQERESIIRAALAEADQQRIVFAPVRDYYDKERWVAAVRAAAARFAGTLDRIALVGHRKDATSSYLSDFRGWEFLDIGYQGNLHAKALRAALFAAGTPQAGLAAIAGQVPQATIDFLRGFCRLPAFEQLREDWLSVDEENSKWAGSPYPPVFVTVDALVRIADHVLLIRRGRAPGKGLLALPGGFIEERETVLQSALRELTEETRIGLMAANLQDALREVKVFDHPDRSQRGRVITHAHYFAYGDGALPEVAAGDDAREAMWVPIDRLASLEEQFHDDHFHILDYFLGVRPK